MLSQSNVTGIYDKPPEQPGAKLITSIAVDRDGHFKVEEDDRSRNSNPQGITGDIVFASAEHDTTGGMEAKVKDAINIVRHGFDVLVTKAGTDAAFEAMHDYPECLSSHWLGTHFHLNT